MITMSNIQDEQPLNQEEVKSNDRPNSQVELEAPGEITINVFFDGTGNNMFNTQARLNGEHTELEDETSYGNYYSNIALLFMSSTKTATIKNIYIQGSGTFKHDEDTNLGLGLSQGKSGVYERVKEAFRNIEIIRGLLNAKEITFNVYGFSRGAFYARYFCAMAKLTDQQIEHDRASRNRAQMHGGGSYESLFDTSASGRDLLQLSNEAISINFVGIYDTVSSHGLSHYNDVKPFKLNIGLKQGIRKIVHLTAQNDYRNHFPLTHIDTAADNGIGFECSLPGAHSDIGGAYCDDWHETNYLSTLNERTTTPKVEGEIYWRWFVNMGYYQGEPIFQSNAPTTNSKIQDQLVFTSQVKLKNLVLQKVYANRKFSTNSYQFIPLQILKEITEKETSITFTNPKGKAILAKDIASIDSFELLKKFRDYAREYIVTNYTKSGTYFMVKAGDVLSTEEQKQLYNQFIHNSLDPTTIANGSDSRNKGPQRIKIHDYV